MSNDYLMHYGVKGQKWGIRNYQNYDGTLTEEGKLRYSKIETFTGKDHKKYAIATGKPKRVDPSGYGIENNVTGYVDFAKGVTETEVSLFDVKSGEIKGSFTLRNLEFANGKSMLVGQMLAHPKLLKKGKDALLNMKNSASKYAKDIYKKEPIYM